jgi:hypothetical protein
MEGDWLKDVTPYKVQYPFGKEGTVIAEGTLPSGTKVRIFGDAIVTDPEERRRIDARIRAAIDQVNIGLMQRAAST